MRIPDPSRRVAVTGLGVICAIGRNRDEVWSSILASTDGIGMLSRFPGESFPTDISAEVKGPLDTGLEREIERRLSRSDRLGVLAAREAYEHAGAQGAPIAADDVIVSVGSSTGGLLEGEAWYIRRRARGNRTAALTRILQQPTSGPADAIAAALGFAGGVASNATACASGGASIGFAADMIRSGRVTAAVAGGTDALCRLTYSGFNVLQAVDGEPCKPFDSRRAGITLGEGAGFLFLEDRESAVARGAVILAELLGYGASCDAFHPTAPAEDGRGAASAIRGALRDGDRLPGSVDYVNAHGTGTPLNDPAESAGITTALGDSIPVSSTKSFFGHTLGAAGGLEAVVTVMALMAQTAPETLRWAQRDPACTLDYVEGGARPMKIEHAISNTFGFGGSNVTLLFGREQDRNAG